MGLESRIKVLRKNKPFPDGRLTSAFLSRSFQSFYAVYRVYCEILTNVTANQGTGYGEMGESEPTPLAFRAT